MFESCLLVAMIAASLLPQAIASVQLASGSDRDRGRPIVADVVRTALWRLLPGFVLLGFLLTGTLNLSHVNLTTTWSGPLLGAGSYFFFAVARDLLRREPIGCAAVVRDLRARWPRSKEGKMATAVLVTLHPILEEAAQRGVLVYLVSRITGSVAIGILVGGTMYFATHVYQHSTPLREHLLFLAVTTGLLFSPGGLIASICFHVALNLDYVLSSRRTLSIAYSNRHHSTD